MRDAEDRFDGLALERFLPYRLSVLSNRISSAIARLYADRFGLSIAEWRIMAVLGRFGAMSAGEVCGRTAMDKVQVSRAVARLVEEGRVLGSSDEGDRRRRLLALSAAGRAIYDEVAPLALALEARLLEPLDATDRAVLGRLLDKLEASAAGAFTALPEERAG